MQHIKAQLCDTVGMRTPERRWHLINSNHLSKLKLESFKSALSSLSEKAVRYVTGAPRKGRLVPPPNVEDYSAEYQQVLQVADRGNSKIAARVARVENRKGVYSIFNGKTTMTKPCRILPSDSKATSALPKSRGLGIQQCALLTSRRGELQKTDIDWCLLSKCPNATSRSLWQHYSKPPWQWLSFRAHLDLKEPRPTVCWSAGTQPLGWIKEYDGKRFGSHGVVCFGLIFNERQGNCRGLPWPVPMHC